MKNFLLHLLLFACLFFAVDKLFYVIIARAPSLEVDTKLELVMEGKINKEIVIMGSSRAADNIIASQIEKETNQSTYNLGYQGSNMEFHYFVLKTLLKYNKKPKTVVLIVDNPWEFLPEKSLNFRFDRLYPLVKYNYITQELIDRKEKNIFATFLCLGRLNKGNLNINKEKQSIENPIQSCGSTPFIYQKTKKKFSYQIDNARYPIEKEIKKRVQLFIAFQNTCKNNNIQLVLGYTPNFKSFNTNFENRIKQISLKENFIFVYDTTNVKYKNIYYFYDESHLNYKGAKMFTSEISSFINNLKNAKK